MSVFDILDKRQHVQEFDLQNIPKKSLIEECLRKAWKVTPSKQNFMPYTINVFGPDNEEDKLKIWSLAKFNQKDINENNTKEHKEDGDNPNFLYLKTAPYILVINQRVCKPNPFVQTLVDINKCHFEQMHSDQKNLRNVMKTTAFEVGLFISNLWSFALEYNIDLNCNACFPTNKNAWQEFPNVEHDVIMICALGYCKIPRRNKHTQERFQQDLKPAPQEIIKWINKKGV